MLECLLLAGSLYIHVEHNPINGVETVGSLTWEIMMPLDSTKITLETNPLDQTKDIRVSLTGFRDYDRFELSRLKFPGWTISKFLDTCPSVNVDE